MSVPGFQTLFFPLLRAISDGKDHKMSVVGERLADELELTEPDRNELLQSGNQTVYLNRLGWARTYLKKAGLVESPGRALVKISPRGRSVLLENPAILNVKFLKQFPEFLAFHQPSPGNGEIGQEAVQLEVETPEDTLGRVHKALNKDLAIELVDRIKLAPPSFFERVVVDLMIKMGYGGSREDAGRTVGKSGDGGIDGIINEDRLGLDVIYLQAKRWEGSVGRPVVQAFVGSLAGMRANKGVLITTSCFTPDARGYVQQIGAKVVLIDGDMLGSLMIQYGLAVTTEAIYEVKRVDTDYFDA